MRESQAGWNGCRPISTASIMASHCRSSIGRRPATITFGIFRSIPTDENGLIAKVGQSIPNLILCGLSTNGVTCSLRTRSRFDQERARPWALVDGSGRYGEERPPCSAGLVSWTTNEQSLGRSHLLSSSGRQAQGEERGEQGYTSKQILNYG